MKRRRSQLGLLGSALMIQCSDNTAGHVQRRGFEERKSQINLTSKYPGSGQLTPEEARIADEGAKLLHQALTPR